MCQSTADRPLLASKSYLKNQLLFVTETINYEVPTSILPRVPRIYLRDGQEVEIVCMIDAALHYQP